MPVGDYFSNSYQVARDKFITAARAGGATISRPYVVETARGIAGEELAVDVARIGPEDASRLLLIISGTHGVEGFCGSGCQIGFFTDHLFDAMPKGSGALLIHALNPYGFSHSRRVDEHNVDLNRNFQDFCQPLPASPEYDRLHQWLIPKSWEGAARETADEELDKYKSKVGGPAFQAAIQRGQYAHPTGLFYGGVEPTWSNKTFRQILKENVQSQTRQLIVLDIHTGLGPSGYGEPIYLGPLDADFEHAKQWFGKEVTTPSQGTAVAAEVLGTVADAVYADVTGVQRTFLALEFGTIRIEYVLTALRADHWLHAVTNRKSPLADQIRQQMRDAFYLARPWWNAAVYGRFADFVARAGRALSGS